MGDVDAEAGKDQNEMQHDMNPGMPPMGGHHDEQFGGKQEGPPADEG